MWSVLFNLNPIMKILLLTSTNCSEYEQPCTLQHIIQSLTFHLPKDLMKLHNLRINCKLAVITNKLPTLNQITLLCRFFSPHSTNSSLHSVERQDFVSVCRYHKLSALNAIKILNLTCSLIYVSQPLLDVQSQFYITIRFFDHRSALS
jgi:hypothetical protein